MPLDHATRTPVPGVGPIRVFLLDDHEIVRRGVRNLIETADDIVVVGEAGTAAEARVVVAATLPDVAVLDVRLVDGTGIDVCRAIRADHPEIRCLMLTSFTDPAALIACAVAGASGYVLKKIRGHDLVEDIRSVAAGRMLIGPAAIERAVDLVRSQVPPPDDRLARLTGQERRVLALITEGLTNRQIGARLGLTEKTVKNYVSHLLTKLEMVGRTEAAVYGALQPGLTSLSS